jgi:hypothetical protein
MATDVSCFGGDDGALEVTAIGGTPGYTFSWTGGPVSDTYSDIPEGTYHVVATDSKNCMVMDSFMVSQPDTLILMIDSSATSTLSCGSSDDGVITTEVSGGNSGGYMFMWNPDVSDAYQAVNLPAGHYTITVTDPKGCTDTTSYSMTAPPPLKVTWPVIDPPACFGDESDFLIPNVTGGSGVYAYTINSGEVFDIDEIVSLPAGIYIVSVFDDRGCSQDTTFTIDQPNMIQVSIGPDDPVIDLGDSLFILGSVDVSDNPIATTLWT